MEEKILKTDTELIALLKSGEQAHIDETFYRTYYRAAKSFILRNGGVETEAKDTYHDAIEAMLKQIRVGKLDDLQSPLGFYLIGIVKKLWYKRANRKRDSKEYFLDSDKLYDEIEPESTISLEFLHQAKEAAMSELREECQKILKAFYGDSFSMENIARLLGFTNANSAKSQKEKCMKSVRKRAEIILHKLMVS